MPVYERCNGHPGAEKQKSSTAIRNTGLLFSRLLHALAWAHPSEFDGNTSIIHAVSFLFYAGIFTPLTGSGAFRSQAFFPFLSGEEIGSPPSCSSASGLISSSTSAGTSSAVGSGLSASTTSSIGYSLMFSFQQGFTLACSDHWLGPGLAVLAIHFSPRPGSVAPCSSCRYARSATR
jgi:hypothetical protein